ncbi:MAG: 23S rRNA pseudouridine(1911/1915/1917) synthase RluD [Gammaproteobacteria bacterium]|jgi:23S rRNA pseudouridine1911/1915/1917 synthase
MKQKLTIPAELAGDRIDQALAKLLPEYSRSLIKTWLDKHKITVNGEFWQPKAKVAGDEIVVIDVEFEEQTTHQPEPIDLDIVYEDNDILVINKPAGMVVHPGAGNRASTLLNALLHHTPKLKNIPRAGIIHRLDKDTSGLLVIAKTLKAHTYLVRQLQRRKIHREYETIVYGELISGGTIETQIGRHPTKRTKMAVVDTDRGKVAITHYRIIKKYNNFTHLRVKLETGRTHQIRVHLAHIRHPIVGDQVYGRIRLPKNASEKLIKTLQNFKRQALHASKLGLTHPSTHKWMEWQAKLPQDMQELLQNLAQ